MPTLAFVLFFALQNAAPPALDELQDGHELELQSRWSELADPAAHGLVPGRIIELVQHDSLEGWTPLGDAHWAVEDGAIRGRVGGGAQSFLRTDTTYGDFRLELEFRLHGAGNSGVQVRSSRNESGRVQGLQVEIDPSPRAWSGGLYDEGRRGWLQDLSRLPDARAALDREGWNRYRIECLGPWIRTWINDVPATDHMDVLDLEGFIALQVHAGKDTDVTWRKLQLVDLGRRRWEPLELAPLADRSAAWRLDGRVLIGEPSDEHASALHLPDPWRDFTLRFDVRAHDGAGLHVRFRHGETVTADEQRSATPALFGSRSGWVLDACNATLTSHADDEGWTSVSLAVYGDRIALHAGGHAIADARSASLPREGLLTLELQGARGHVELRRIERLGRPR